MAYRVDHGSLRPPRRLADGRLHADGYLTRTGVFAYRQPDGSTQLEYRPPEEVFHQDALDSFVMVPVTDEHPAGMITKDTEAMLRVGSTCETVRRDGDKVAAGLLFSDPATIAKIEAGKVELSCGYEVDLDRTPGVSPDGSRYDCIQRNIRGNHVALVDIGRAGPEARIRMDGAVMLRDSAKENNMDELQKALSATLAREVAEKARADKAEAERDGEKVRADKAEAERDGEKARADKAEKARADSDATIAQRVAARADLERQASKVLGEKFDAKASDLSLKISVVEHIDGCDLPEDKKTNEVYVDARFDSAISRADEADESRANAREAATDNSPREDADEDKARADMLRRYQELSRK